jgi:hypothetical protein
MELERMGFSRHPAKDTELLRMTEWVDEIATSHRTLLAIRLCHNYSVNYLPPLMLIFYSNIGNR